MLLMTLFSKIFFTIERSNILLPKEFLARVLYSIWKKKNHSFKIRSIEVQSQMSQLIMIIE